MEQKEPTVKTFEFKIGKEKDIIILPKAIREEAGIEEGEEVEVEVRKGEIIIRKKRKDLEKLKESLERHAELIRQIPGIKYPKPGDVYYLEEEFEDE